MSEEIPSCYCCKDLHKTDEYVNLRDVGGAYRMAMQERNNVCLFCEACGAYVIPCPGNFIFLSVFTAAGVPFMLWPFHRVGCCTDKYKNWSGLRSRLVLSARPLILRRAPTTPKCTAAQPKCTASARSAVVASRWSSGMTTPSCRVHSFCPLGFGGFPLEFRDDHTFMPNCSAYDAPYVKNPSGYEFGFRPSQPWPPEGAFAWQKSITEDGVRFGKPVGVAEVTMERT